ncbi:LysR family transcriptional regulator [Vibrio mediterranei]|jgi:DNA-binding transcriptional LysR family regulator|uniref:LysR family transcriptional regulator n=1 Tax=Vibrio mediterranei TaxID=689 RepID=UPI00078653A6|nr:LysR family transcriptional regulator [Vibrio mediterranei]MCG9659366.1 LysR family transcriptional regulator [Vibrio mediterranei]PTC06586.1 LysR family transcriptional regulator [Vibrio mediterranei]SBO08776.1 HTH-type transcriptional regulator CatM [Vibrio mediterranei]
MNIDLLKAFVTLARSDTYRSAAEALFITQSALTKKIYRLESDIGATLFDRNRGGTKLSIVGECLLPEAKRVIASAEKFDQLSNQVATGQSGYLNIGFGISSFDIAPRHISEFKQRFSHVHVTLNDFPSQTQTEQLLSGELHVAYSRLPCESSLSSITLSSDRLCVAINHSHSESSLTSIFASLPYLALRPERGMGLHQQISKVATELNWQLKPSQFADDILTLLSLVKANIGFAIVPESANTLIDSTIHFIPISASNYQWDIGVTWNPKFNNPARDRYINLLKTLEHNKKV